jgi:uncharacterized protein (DUF58 family)
MELKESALVTIGISLFILLMGVFTGVILFYLAVAFLVIFIFVDFYRLLSIKRSIGTDIGITSELSRNEIYLGSSVCLVCRLVNSGNRTQEFRLDQPLDDRIKSNTVWRSIKLLPGSTIFLDMWLNPDSGGQYTFEPPRVAAVSWLFRDSFSAGEKLELNVLPPMGVIFERIGSNGIRSKLGHGMFDATTVKGGQGIDFRAVKKYEGGDDVRHIDWVRSSRANELIVRDYEEELSIPVFFLMDLDTTMSFGEPSALQAAVGLVTDLGKKYLVGLERIGFIGFSRSGVAYFIPPRMGIDHLYNLRLTLSRLETIDSEDNVYRHDQDSLPFELKRMFKEINQADFPLDEMLLEYSANIKDDGFSQAAKSALRCLNTPSRLVVITNLSMGLASLANNARIATYYGHRVSVVLMPHMWHDDPGQAEVEANSAATTLIAIGVDAIVMHPDDKSDNIIKLGASMGIKARVKR